MRVAEEIFLVAHGWKKLGDDSWQRPSYLYGQAERHESVYGTGHAVNSQKWSNRHERGP